MRLQMGLFSKRQKKAPPDCDGCKVKENCLQLCFGLWLHSGCNFLRSDEPQWCSCMKADVPLAARIDTINERKES